jgi:DUF4097 and DUF4098 domain-containing protein YvlB
MNTLIKPFMLVALVAVAPPALAENIDVTRDLAPDGTVKVSNVAGEITIQAWDRSEVHLTGELGRDQELEIIESSSGVQFEVSNIEDEDDYDETLLKLMVPLGASIIAEGISADITIDGSTGESVVAESVSGDVEVAARVSRVELSSVSGDVTFEGSAQRGSFETVSGDLEVAGISGEVSMSTVSGDAVLAAGELERGQFETVSGTLELTLSLAAGGRLTAEAMSGDVDLNVPAGQEGEFNVQTFSGDIRSVYGAAEDESFGPGSRLKHIEGGSGAQFRIESFSGDVRIGHK